MSRARIALCLGGGGATGAMFQIGALAALEDAIEGIHANSFDLYVGASSGASVAAAIAGGRPVQRIYRAILDPADNYFPLERKHLLRMDVSEWRRAIASGVEAIQQGAESLIARRPAASPAVLWQQLDRLYDSLPAGVYSLDAYERFLEDFFVRRGVPNNFAAMPRELRVVAYDLDSAEPVVFGRDGFDREPVTRSCIASMALPPFFSPVRIGDRHYIDAGATQAASVVETAIEENADVIVVVNALVPVVSEQGTLGSGRRESVRDKGLMWVTSQAGRIAAWRSVSQAVAGAAARGPAVLLIEPEPTDGILFLHNPASFSARRNILEYGYRTTRARVAKWIARGSSALERTGWELRVSSRRSSVPSASPTA